MSVDPFKHVSQEKVRVVITEGSPEHHSPYVCRYPQSCPQSSLHLSVRPRILRGRIKGVSLCLGQALSGVKGRTQGRAAAVVAASATEVANSLVLDVLKRLCPQDYGTCNAELASGVETEQWDRMDSF